MLRQASASGYSVSFSPLAPPEEQPRPATEESWHREGGVGPDPSMESPAPLHPDLGRGASASSMTQQMPVIATQETQVRSSSDLFRQPSTGMPHDMHQPPDLSKIPAPTSRGAGVSYGTLAAASTHHRSASRGRVGSGQARETFYFQRWLDVLTDPSLTEAEVASQLLSLGDDFEQAASHFMRVLCVSRRNADPPRKHLVCAATLRRVLERFLPDSMQTLSDFEIKEGLAGGRKYAIQSILFKFAVADVHSRSKLYGTDQYAGNIRVSKVAAHELKAANAISRCGVPHIHVPMMALLDYLGFRVFAVVQLPIHNDTTHIGGSSDSGVTVRQPHSDPKATALLQEVAWALNVQEHTVYPRGGGEPVSVIGPFDLEVHAIPRDPPPIDGTPDKTYMLLDLARMMPPDCIPAHAPQPCDETASDLVPPTPHDLPVTRPSLTSMLSSYTQRAAPHSPWSPPGQPAPADSTQTPTSSAAAQSPRARRQAGEAGPEQGQQLSNLLRPELVHIAPCAVCSDAMFKITTPLRSAVPYDPTSTQGLPQLQHALHNVLIPAVAAHMDRMAGVLQPMNLPFGPYVQFRQSGGVGRGHGLLFTSALVHSYGVNIRHMGRVYAAAKSTSARRLLLSEMVARTLKANLITKLQCTQRKTTVSQMGGVTHELKRIALMHFFSVLSDTPQAGNARGERFAAALHAKFPGLPPVSKCLEDYRAFKQMVDVRGALERCCLLSGVQLAEHLQEALVSGKDTALVGDTASAAVRQSGAGAVRFVVRVRRLQLPFVNAFTGRVMQQVWRVLRSIEDGSAEAEDTWAGAINVSEIEAEALEYLRAHAGYPLTWILVAQVYVMKAWIVQRQAQAAAGADRTAAARREMAAGSARDATSDMALGNLATDPQDTMTFHQPTLHHAFVLLWIAATHQLKDGAQFISPLTCPDPATTPARPRASAASGSLAWQPEWEDMLKATLADWGVPWPALIAQGAALAADWAGAHAAPQPTQRAPQQPSAAQELPPCASMHSPATVLAARREVALRLVRTLALVLRGLLAAPVEVPRMGPWVPCQRVIRTSTHQASLFAWPWLLHRTYFLLADTLHQFPSAVTEGGRRLPHDVRQASKLVRANERRRRWMELTTRYLMHVTNPLQVAMLLMLAVWGVTMSIVMESLAEDVPWFSLGTDHNQDEYTLLQIPLTLQHVLSLLSLVGLLFLFSSTLRRDPRQEYLLYYGSWTSPANTMPASVAAETYIDALVQFHTRRSADGGGPSNMSFTDAHTGQAAADTHGGSAASPHHQGEDHVPAVTTPQRAHAALHNPAAYSWGLGSWGSSAPSQDVADGAVDGELHAWKQLPFTACYPAEAYDWASIVPGSEASASLQDGDAPESPEADTCASSSTSSASPQS